MRTIASFVLLVLLVLLASVVGVTVIVGWAVGLGWLASQFLPLTLFEASLLVMVASIIVVYVGVSLLKGASVPALEDLDEGMAPIDISRFSDDPSSQTFGDWFRFEAANDIYLSLLDKTNVANTMNETQIEELSIRLTDVVVAVLRGKRTRSRSRHISVTRAQLAKQLVKDGQQPYDNDLLDAAVEAVNARLAYDEELAQVINERIWNKSFRWVNLNNVD